MNKFKRFVSLALVLCMVMAFVPVGASATEDASYAYNIVHVDAGRKYFSVDSLKTIIDNAAAAGFNQVELYLSDNQGFRFALDDMTLTTEYDTYNLAPALGDGYDDGSKYPDGSGQWLTEAEMDEIIAYANGVDIDIVPCINVPGHMGAILEEFPSFRYSSSLSSIDLDNDEAVAFALALTEKYAAYFASRGCKFYNVGADEYANDMSSMGFEGMGSALYTKFVQFLNDAADIVTGLDMTPRAFNDGFYYKDYSISIEPDKAYEVCYWSSGWSGYDVAAATTIAAKGHKMINTNGDYYWILGDSNYKCTASKASQFDTTAFSGSTVSAPAGSMFCIWCDVANADGTDGGTAVAADTADVIAAFGGALPAVESLVSSGETTDPTDPTDSTEATEPEYVTLTDNGVSVTVPGLTDLTADETTAPAIEGAGSVLAYEVVPVTDDGVYTGSAEVTVSVSADWTNVRGGVLASESGEEVLGISGKLENGTFTFTVPHLSTVVVYDLAESAAAVTQEDITLDIGGTTEKTIEGANHEDNWSVADDSIVTVTVTGEDAVEAIYNHTEANVTCGNLISSNSTSWVRTGYYYTPDNGANYYPVYAQRSSTNNIISTTYTYTWGYSVSDSASAVTQIGDTQSVSSWYPNTAPSITVYNRTTGAGHDAYTTITFEGKYPGTTTVTVGDVQYNVTVNYLTQNVSLAPTNSVSYEQTSAIEGEAEFTVSGIVSAEINGNTVTFTGVAEGTTVATVGNTKYTITVKYNEVAVSMVTDGTASYTQSAPIADEAEFTVEGIASAVISGSTVTFTAIKVGSTVATVGNTRYTITVSEEDLTTVTPLTVEYWITNANLTDSDTGLNYMQIEATDEGVNSESGVAFTALVPNVIFETRNREYWQVRLLDVLEENTSSSGTEHQTNGPGDDETMNGDAITYVRYWKGKWQGMSGTTWLDIDTSTVSGKYMDSEKNETYKDRSRHQLVAYYMEVVDIQNANGTTELHINASDWGKKGDGSEASDYLPTDTYCSVSLQIVYEDGSTNPAAATAENLRGKTIVFGYWSGGRGIGTLNFDGLDQFQIYKITAETGSVSASFSDGAWGSVTVNSLSWDSNEKTVWEGTPTQKASINNNAKSPDSTDPKDNLMWDENQEAILIRVYVKALQTQNALNVHYIDSSANDLEFYNYSIAVAGDAAFNSGFAMGTEKNTLVNNTVVNYYGTTQTVSADLASMPQIKAYYRYCDYTLVKVELKNGGKDAYLYYTFTPVVSFVADFGLPLIITPADLNKDAYADESDVKGVKVIGTYDTEAGTTAHSEYGVLAADSSFNVTYTPDEVLQGVDFFTIYVLTTLDDPSTNVTNEEAGIAYRVYIFPATTVLYEESFITTTGGTWDAEGKANAGNQETEKAGSDSVNYGWTAGYTAEGMTGGTELVSKAAASTAEFTFTGTGVDIYANCDPDCGMVVVQLQAKNDEGKWVSKRVFMVDTAAGAGTSTVTAGQAEESFGLPIVSVDGLDHDTYRVVLQHSGYGTEYGDVRLDGFRVYNTLGDLTSSAYPTTEQSPNYLELRDAVLTGLHVGDYIDDTNETNDKTIESLYETASTILSQVFTGTEGDSDLGLIVSGESGKDEFEKSELTTEEIQDLLDNGPKNELFLWPEEAATFNLGDAKAQIGMKAPMGATSYVITDIASGTIETAADLFYKYTNDEGENLMTGTIVIKNTGDKPLSITKLKLFGAKKLQPLTVEDVAYTLSVLGYTDGGEKLARPGAPIANPFVDVAEGSWYYDSVLWAVKEGITTGADATHFLPDALCQRATVVTMLWRAAGSPEPETTVNPFVDVTGDSFFYKAVLWAVENGITNGVDATHFAPFGTCNRAQVVTFLWRANGKPASSAVNPFADVAEGQWYTDAVLWAVENDITNGMSSSLFGVESLCNRAQIVTFLYRAAK